MHDKNAKLEHLVCRTPNHTRAPKHQGPFDKHMRVARCELCKPTWQLGASGSGFRVEGLGGISQGSMFPFLGYSGAANLQKCRDDVVCSASRKGLFGV